MAKPKLFVSRALEDTSPNGLVAFAAKLQDAISASVSSLLDSPLAEHTVRKNVSLVAGSVNHVAHGLGRPARGYIVTRKRSYGDMREAAQQSVSDRYMDIEVTANMVVDFIFF